MIKKIILILTLIIFLALVLVSFLRFNSEEDSWIKDSNGLWIKHGNPSTTPENVQAQLDAISCASELYALANINNLEFSSQCLGKCSSYSIDIVNSPRTEEDNLEENQCNDYKTGVTKNFIELNQQGQIVRIKD